MTNGLLIALFSVPFLASVVVAVLLRRSSTGARRVALVASGATALCATALLSRAGDDPSLVVRWLPGTGPMRFGLGATGLYAALVTTWVAFLTLLGTTSADTEAPPLLLAVILLALSAANAAFLSEHFLSRYVALEVVALTIALAPLIELRGEEGGRGFWLVYVLLRLGDVGLLSAIKILYATGGTLEITPALEAAGTLSGARLGWVIFGLLLAVWVKLGIWPLHPWVAWGRELRPGTQAWLYATAMPNLGAYLLYRVTPLLAPDPGVQTLLLWLAAGAAMLAVITALTRRDLRSGLVYVAAARGAFLVFAAVAGTKAAVWLGLLATTPLQLLLFLAGEAPERGTPSVRGRAAQGLFAMAGLGLTGVGLLITHWARQSGMPLDTLFVAEITLALLAIWTVREATRSHEREVTGSLPARWVAMGTLGVATLIGGVAFGPLAGWLMDTAGVPPLGIPSPVTFLRYLVSAPALLLTLLLGLVTWQMQRRSRIRLHVPGPADGRQTETTYDLQEGLEHAARALRAIVEVGFLEQLIVVSVRVVVDGARVTHRVVEQEGLEGLLRRAVHGVLELSREVGRRHTGLLRRNLLWIPVSLMVALVATLAFW